MLCNNIYIPSPSNIVYGATMSSTLQFSLNNQREVQLFKVITKREDLNGQSMSDAAKTLLFEAMDKIVPVTVLDEKGAPDGKGGQPRTD